MSEHGETYYDISIRMTCKACADTLAERILKGNPARNGGATSIAVAEVTYGEDGKKGDSNITRIAACRLYSWPAFEACLIHSPVVPA